jgi:RNA polymerase sigma-70 factor (ECF subfamily)
MKPNCATLYEEHFEFVRHNAGRLGVAESVRDDLVHEVFMVVHRRLADFEGRSSAQTWIYGILLRIVSDHHRQDRQRTAKESEAAAERCVVESERLTDDLFRKEATQIVDRILQTMDEEKRTIFVLHELKETDVPEAARVLGINLNTAYARLRAARLHFTEAVKRMNARSRHDQQRHWWGRA